MVIQDLLPDFLANQIKTEICSTNFPWYFNEKINYGDDKNLLFQFTHSLYIDGQIVSNYYNSVLPIIQFFEEKVKLKIKSIHRIKANLTTKYNLLENEIENLMHTDMQKHNYVSLIYYVDDSDGDTLIYDRNELIKITPKYNQLCYFKSIAKHAGLFPKIHKRRIVINFILEFEP